MTKNNLDMIELKGMAWDHPRGYEPLIAASNEFRKSNPNVSIKWDVRSLKEFGDMPIEDIPGVNPNLQPTTTNETDPVADPAVQPGAPTTSRPWRIRSDLPNSSMNPGALGVSC